MNRCRYGFGLVAIATAAAMAACAGKPRDAAKRDVPATHTDPQVADAALASYRSALERTRRAKLDIALEPMPRDDVMASKVGGRAYVPAGGALPRDASGRALRLLAQIDFAHAPQLAGYPKDGMLQFFIAADDFYGANLDSPVDMQHLSMQKNFRVLYWPAPLAAAAPRTLLMKPDGEASLPFDPAKPRRMRFVAGSETISRGDVGFERAIGQDLAMVARSYATRSGLDPEAVDSALAEATGASGHKLGGYPFFTQTDPRTPDDQQVLLLQLDTDDGMMWGDSGVANFFIDPRDLARRDFSKVAYNWDCL